jgi:vacuolar-type H+-ATPase catalytic subunit A/Vma1
MNQPTQPVTKDMLLRQVDGLRDLSRRARRLAENMPAEEDRRRLGRYVEELDERASALEHQAADAKTGQFAVAAPRPAS